MRTFDFYILRETVRPLGLALIIAMLVLLIERLLRLLDLMLGAQGPLKLILEILAYLIPHYISLALPMSLLIGVMIAFNRLSRDGELDALQGSGLSLARLSRAPLLMAAAVAIIAGITFGYLKPYGRYAYQAMIYTVGNAALQAFVQPGVFTQFGDTTFLVGAIGREAGSFAEVFVYQDNDDRSTAITARDGTLTRSAEDGTPVLRLFDGVRLSESVSGAPRRGRTADPSIGVLRFDELRMELGDAQAQVFRPRGADEREFTIVELWQRRNAPPPGIRSSDMIAEFNVRLATTLSVPLLPLLGIPLALGRRRSDQSWGIAAGLLILILYNQVLDLGKNMTESGEVGPVVGLWLPFVAFALLTCWLFQRSSSRLPQGTGFDFRSLPLVQSLAGMAGRLARRGG